MKGMWKKAAALVLALGLSVWNVLGAEPTTQMVEVNGAPTVFFMYTDYDTYGFATNYVKLRDVAWALNGTQRQFSVEYDGSTKVTTGAEYIPDGSEVVPLSYDVVAEGVYRAVITVDGVGHQLDAYLIRPRANADGNFYFKLRDLGAAIGFTVGWSGERGVYIETEPS